MKINLSGLVCVLVVGGFAIANMSEESCAAENLHTKAPVLSATSGRTKCSFGAFVMESDSAGLNVRQSPGPSGKIIGTLPPLLEVDGYKVKIEVDVLGGKNGWFYIAHARDNTMLTGKPARKVYSGRGWVSGRKLTVKSQSKFGYAFPSKGAAVVLSLNDGFDGDRMVEAGQLISCQGHWALVEYSSIDKLRTEAPEMMVAPPTLSQEGLPKGHVRAWVDQICGIQETTCDGVE